VVGRVVAREGAYPLPYSIVGIPDLGREQFTDDSGAFRLGGLPQREITIRVRRLGFTPVEARITPRAGGVDTLHIALNRVAVSIATVEIRAHPPCHSPGAPSLQADSLTAFVFAQLRQNAEQFRLLSREYPFAYVMQIVRSQTDRRGRESKVSTDSAPSLSQTSWSYLPGGIIGRYRGNLMFNIPTLLDLADARFVDNHCFHNGGLVELDDEPLIRIDVVAAERIRSPDVHGTMYLDPISYQIRRTVFRLSKMPDIRGMTEMEVTTLFEDVLPSIPVIRAISSVQRLNAGLRGVSIREAREEQKIIAFSWLGRRPGEEKPATDP
jgi:hypothetical protein